MLGSAGQSSSFLHPISRSALPLPPPSSTAASPSSAPSSALDALSLDWLTAYRWRDVLFLWFGCCALYLTLRLQADVQLSVQWTEGVGPVEGVTTSVSTSPSFPVPLPVIADVDGDGRNGQ